MPQVDHYQTIASEPCNLLISSKFKLIPLWMTNNLWVHVVNVVNTLTVMITQVKVVILFIIGIRCSSTQWLSMSVQLQAGQWAFSWCLLWAAAWPKASGGCWHTDVVQPGKLSKSSRTQPEPMWTQTFIFGAAGWGMGIFMVSSVGCGLANSFWTLLLCRIAMGAGEASIINLTGEC